LIDIFLGFNQSFLKQFSVEFVVIGIFHHFQQEMNWLPSFYEIFGFDQHIGWLLPVLGSLSLFPVGLLCCPDKHLDVVLSEAQKIMLQLG